MLDVNDETAVFAAEEVTEPAQDDVVIVAAEVIIAAEDEVEAG